MSSISSLTPHQFYALLFVFLLIPVVAMAYFWLAGYLAGKLVKVVLLHCWSPLNKPLDMRMHLFGPTVAFFGGLAGLSYVLLNGQTMDPLASLCPKETALAILDFFDVNIHNVLSARNNVDETSNLLWGGPVSAIFGAIYATIVLTLAKFSHTEQNIETSNSLSDDDINLVVVTGAIELNLDD